ncbi:hypothetical protein B0H10DRAFT_1956375 [Mycena sp. CBHHK59/15]|nr:hypothetical protein B0H10DRAFT_1956375 [Mycena sp. CBHHK59/15]
MCTVAGPGARPAYIDPYSAEMDIKFNVEGSNIQEIVFLCQDNDAVNRKLSAQEEMNAELLWQLEELKARSGLSADLTNTRDRNGVDGDGPDVISDELKKKRDKNTELQKRLALSEVFTDPPDVAKRGPAPQSIPRPAGSARSGFSIQDAMGLGGNAADREAYKAIQRNLRDLTLNACINIEVPWADMPAVAKAQLFAVARERHPYLAAFVNDWATEELVKQYIKNKCKHTYKQNWLVPPTKFAYLKANSAKRDQSAPQGRKQKLEKATTAAKKSTRKSASTSKKALSSKKSSSSNKSKEKHKAPVVCEDKDEEMTEKGAHEGGVDDDEYNG